MKNFRMKFAVVLCFCLIAFGCEDETITSSKETAINTNVDQAKTKTTKDSKFLKNMKVVGVLEDNGTFKGKVSITEFGYSETEGLWVSGFLHGTAKAADGTATEIEQSFSQVPATLNESSSNARYAKTLATQATCDILFLDLGPLHLDLLGLTLDLSEIVLDINAVSGAGNLLGNLLCAVAGLLDPFGFLTDLINTLQTLLDLLNQINNLIG